MLHEDDVVEPVRIAPGALVQHGGVEPSRRRAEVGRTHVVGKAEPDHRLLPPDRASVRLSPVQQDEGRAV